MAASPEAGECEEQKAGEGGPSTPYWTFAAGHMLPPKHRGVGMWSGEEVVVCMAG